MAITFKAPQPSLVSERFDIESRLGSGGFGVVYRAFDRELGARVALKTLHETNPRSLYRFKREFRSLADIAHPNLVTLYELISEGELWYFTMELIDGLDFLGWLQLGDPTSAPDASRSIQDTAVVEAATVEIDATLARETSELASPTAATTGELESLDGRKGRCPVDIDRVRHALEQLTRGVMALHGFGKLHRDIKPSNVMIDGAGRVVLLDFGMVTEVGPRKNLLQKLERESNPNQVKFAGTPRYMSPEQAMGESLDEATDWYAVGAMLYEALTGEPPVTGDTPLQLLLRKQTVEPTPISELVEGVPADLEELCMGLLRLAPEERPGGKEILESLGAVADPRSLTSSLRSSSSMRRPSFVGRADQLESLRRTMMRCVHGGSLAVANVHGASGMGKTALVQRFLDALGKEPFQPVVLEGRCYENESVPYKALDSLIDELSTQLHRFSQEEVAEWLEGDIDALTRLFPVLERAPAVRDALEDAEPAKLDSHTLRARAFTALRNLLEGLARKHVVVVYIDDVQWGDEDSAMLLKELLAPPNPPPLFLVTTWRSEDAETSPFLSTFLPALDKFGDHLTRLDVQLGELDDDEALELAASLLSEEARRVPQRVEAIAREAKGNPFFIDELARHTQAHDTGPDSDLTSLGDVIYRRVEQLAEPARRLLEVLAVAAQPLDRRIARQVANLDNEEQSVLATLRGEHLLRVKSARDYEWLEPYHARIGETLVDRLGETTLVGYHRSLAHALEAQGHFDPETVAHHFLAADNRAKAGHYSLVAANRASEALAFERAARLYEQALELRDWPDKRVSLLEKLGTTYGYLGRGPRAAAAFLEAAELADAQQALDFRIRAAEQLLRGGQFDRGMEVIEEVLRHSGFEPPSSKLRMISSIAWKRFRLHRRGFAVESRPRDTIPDETLSRLEALWTAAKMLGIIDPIASAYYHYHCIWEALESGSPAHLALTLCQQAAQESSTTDNDELANRLLDQAESLVGICEDPEYVQGYVDFLRGFNAYTGGSFERGRQLIRQARQRLTENCTGVVWEVTTFHFLEFFPTYWLGEFDAFAQQMPKMLEHAKERNDRFHMVALRSWMYPAHLRADRPQKARTDLEQALGDWSRQGYHMQHFWYLQGSIETALYEGNGLNAWSLFQEHRGPLKRSLLLQSKIINQIALNLEARSAVAALRRTSGFFARWKIQRAARRALAKLRAEDAAWVDGLADLVEAELSVEAGKVDRACALLESAEHAMEDHDLALHARAARRRRGELLGGDEGAELIRSAEVWMEENGIENPAAMTAMITAAPRHRRPQLPSG
ncbi:protein kinase domain-containing protein [Persicimonas caeni]|nr:serine/threonine-protein kinase [Persicimonas caeni]